MFLYKIVERCTDYHAFFRGYYFMDRKKVKEAINKIRKEKPQGDGDALDKTSLIIAESCLQEIKVQKDNNAAAK